MGVSSLPNPKLSSIFPTGELPAVDHVAIAVASLAEALPVYRLLGARIGEIETVPQEAVRLVMIQMHNSRIELLEATSEESVIRRFLARHGAGIHHIALAVENIDALWVKMQEKGLTASSEVRTGAEGHRYFFLHPRKTGGSLIELVGK